MSNIASLLKAEITRISRKQTRAETKALQQASSRYRSDIAQLKRNLDALERRLRVLARSSAIRNSEAQSDETSAPSFRFRAPGFAAHRQRLGLSAREAGLLLGVSALTIYKWETGHARPRARHMEAVAAFRKLGKRQAQAIAASRS